MWVHIFYFPLFFPLLLLPLRPLEAIIAQQQAEVYLTINARAYTEPNGTVVRRRLEVNWYGGHVEAGDVVRIKKDGVVIAEVKEELTAYFFIFCFKEFFFS